MCFFYHCFSHFSLFYFIFQLSTFLERHVRIVRTGSFAPGQVFLEILADPKLFLTSGLNELGGSLNRSTINIDLYFCIKPLVG